MNILQTRALAVMVILLAAAIPLLHPARIDAQSPAPSAPPAAANPPQVNVTSLVFTVEVYAMRQDDAAQVLELSGSGEARHNAVLALMKAGKARLETLLSSAGKSGSRQVVESLDEVRYTTEWKDGESIETGDVFSSAFETRNVGDSLEAQLTESPDGKLCDLKYFVLQRTRLLGFSDAYTNPRKPLFVPQPRFQRDKIDTFTTLDTGKSEFLGTLSNAPQFDSRGRNESNNETRLAFGRIDSTYPGPDDLPVPASTNGGGNSPSDLSSRASVWPNLELELTFYSLDRETARRILSEGFDHDQCYSAVKALAARHQATLERLTVLHTKSGQKAAVEELNEVRYPSEFGLKSSGTNADGSANVHVEPTDIDTRDAGLTFEAEPTIDSSGKMVDLDIYAALVSYEGDLQTTGSTAKVQRQPLFETRKITSGGADIRGLLGEHTFIGTFSHPGDDGVNGRKDDGRVWLGFVRTTL